MTELVERADQLTTLAQALRSVSTARSGQFVLLGGEAGVGKTSLLREFCASVEKPCRVLWGACEPLLTARPLGPFFDVAKTTGGELEELVSGAAKPHEVAAALLWELSGGRATVLVLEDLHWADEATLDVMRLLARRVESVPCLVLASYRDDELERSHPLRLILGELGTTPPVTRLIVLPLSPDGVRRLAEPHGVDAETLHAQTGGNPFYVTEVLATRAETVPATVRDAVLARVARLSDSARALIDILAVVSPGAEVWLLEEVGPDELPHLEECLASGTVVSDGQRISFRHELARVAVEEEIPADRRVALHRAAARALAARSGSDAARIAHHADLAQDGAMVLEFARTAAARAAELGAHREAAAQLERAVRFFGLLSDADRADLLEMRAHECYLSYQLDAATEAQEQVVALRRRVGDRLLEGNALRSLARIHGFAGKPDEGARAAHRAVELLEPLGPTRELARAYATLAQRYANWDELEAAIGWGRRAIELARGLGDRKIEIYATVSMAAAEFRRGSIGLEQFERCLGLAREAGNDDEVGRIHANIALFALRSFDPDRVRKELEVGMAFCEEHGLEYWESMLRGVQARLELDAGNWDRAVDLAVGILRNPRAGHLPISLAGVVQGLVRARRGDPGVWTALDAALAAVTPTREPQQLSGPIVARVEAAWLEGRVDDALAESEAARALAPRIPWEAAAIAVWRRRCGVSEEVDLDLETPYSLELTGCHEGAAERWRQLGYPYEAALALCDSDDESLLRRAHEELRQLGAAPAAAILARRLRERGATGLPRGPRASTRDNPSGLTAREVEVLALLAEGLRNADIAKRLFLSEKTVGHHVSAILRKLDVRGRGEAVAKARREGIVDAGASARESGVGRPNMGISPDVGMPRRA